MGGQLNYFLPVYLPPFGPPGGGGTEYIGGEATSLGPNYKEGGGGKTSPS